MDGQDRVVVAKKRRGRPPKDEAGRKERYAASRKKYALKHNLTRVNASAEDKKAIKEIAKERKISMLQVISLLVRKYKEDKAKYMNSPSTERTDKTQIDHGWTDVYKSKKKKKKKKKEKREKQNQTATDGDYVQETMMGNAVQTNTGYRHNDIATTVKEGPVNVDDNELFQVAEASNQHAGDIPGHADIRRTNQVESGGGCSKEVSTSLWECPFCQEMQPKLATHLAQKHNVTSKAIQRNLLMMTRRNHRFTVTRKKATKRRTQVRKDRACMKDSLQPPSVNTNPSVQCGNIGRILYSITGGATSQSNPTGDANLNESQDTVAMDEVPSDRTRKPFFCHMCRGNFASSKGLNVHKCIDEYTTRPGVSGRTAGILSRGFVHVTIKEEPTDEINLDNPPTNFMGSEKVNVNEYIPLQGDGGESVPSHQHVHVNVKESSSKEIDMDCSHQGIIQKGNHCTSAGRNMELQTKEINQSLLGQSTAGYQ